jgi:hypothetical protein
MSNEHVTDRLDDYLDDRLPLEARELLETHLEDCESCAAALRDHEPVALGELPFDGGDDLRRTVRRALGRTAIDAAALAVIVIIVGLLTSLFVVQPLLINRSDRAAVAARAAYEAPMLFNPGAEVFDFKISSGLLNRTVASETRVRQGSGTDEPEVVSSQIGLFRIDLEWATRTNERPVGTREVLPGLADGTVVTVAIGPESPLSIADTQSLADDPGHDVRLTWVGFDVQSSRFGTVGYPLCLSDDHLSDELFAASSAGFSGWSTGALPSVQGALDSAREALDLIVSQDEVADAMSRGDAGSLSSIAEAMDGERMVTTVVVTGPTPEVAAFLDDLGGGEGQVLAVGFYSWGSPVCGR